MTLGAAKNRLKRCVRWDLFVAYYHFLMYESLNNSFGSIWETSRLFYLCFHSVHSVSGEFVCEIIAGKHIVCGAALHIVLSLG
jgi:hypothetical protein